MDDMATEIFGGIRENYQSQYVSFAYANNGNNAQGSAPAVNMNSANNVTFNDNAMWRAFHCTERKTNAWADATQTSAL